jgi:hypothetical protein
LPSDLGPLTPAFFLKVLIEIELGPLYWPLPESDQQNPEDFFFFVQNFA